MRRDPLPVPVAGLLPAHGTVDAGRPVGPLSRLEGRIRLCRRLACLFQLHELSLRGPRAVRLLPRPTPKPPKHVREPLLRRSRVFLLPMTGTAFFDRYLSSARRR